MTHRYQNINLDSTLTQSIAFRTTDATPRDVTLASLPNVGDAFQIPGINVTGRVPDGSGGISAFVAGSVMHQNTPLIFLITNAGGTATWLGFAGTVIIGAVGTDFVARCTGVAATNVDWLVTWSMIPIASIT